jgi:hypothetical protein
VRGLIDALVGGASGGGSGGGGGAAGTNGGGGDCSGTVCDVGELIMIAVFVVLGLVMAGLLIAWQLEELRHRLRVRQAEAAARAAGGEWDPESLYARVQKCFNVIQGAWERRDLDAARPFVSDALHERHRLQLEGLEKQNRRNRIQDLWLRRVRIVRIHREPADEDDRFVVEISCTARDWMEDTRTGAVINGNSRTPTKFTQYWTFVRDAEGDWVLDEIQEEAEGRYHWKSATRDPRPRRRAEAHTPA